MIKFIKKLAYWGAGIFCAILVFLVVAPANFSINIPFGSHRVALSNSDNNYQRTDKALIKGELYRLYEDCKSYWAKTNRTNTCNVDIASLTSYGLVNETGVSIWGESGDEFSFTAYGKRYGGSVIKLEGFSGAKPYELIFRELENEELESALIEMKQTDPERAR